MVKLLGYNGKNWWKIDEFFKKEVQKIDKSKKDMI